ncbi:hypothetical protein [Gracilibacillus salinarum]|uniref:Multi-TM2 domain-containing protein n=1 Tax=Gracilibacillus salinarum TaxID=2932255 RepID=A0ABY4GQ13_9BACI|nr:hypothetical protein [Gracilibacillus salinarum]UOQ85802.1 hypothetical protein MUN87_02535 [Gracilibacillus salinarum]
MNNKSAVFAFFLSFFPGFGQIYWGKTFRGVIYTLAFFGGVFVSLFSAFTGFVGYSEFYILMFLLLAIIWFINLIDMIVTILHAKPTGVGHAQAGEYETNLSNERVKTIIFSVIPGIGHFYIGLTYRGLTLLSAFIGIITIVFFISILTSGVFLIFLLILPIIWVYSLFDVIQLLNRKQAGELLEDKTILDDFERARNSENKSRVLAVILSIFPGAGHLYLGLQKRGLQLMAVFLFSIYILDVLHLSLFLFLIPIVWFYSFFDTLQTVNRIEYENVQDVPIFKNIKNNQKWIGIGLVVLGLFYLFDHVILPVLGNLLGNHFWHYYNSYFQVSIVCLLLIGGGMKLALMNRKKKS